MWEKNKEEAQASERQKDFMFTYTTRHARVMLRSESALSALSFYSCFTSNKR